MKILIFDDTPAHRLAAKLTLVGHDLTIVGTYDEAQKALVPQRDYEKAKQILPSLLKKSGMSPNFEPHGANKDAPQAEKDKYWALHTEAGKLATSHPDFDAVLTDLLVPASRQAQGPDGSQFVGKEMPLGTTIALLALVAGVKKVAVVTDMNHHNHPASAAFDCFGGLNKSGANIICTNRVSLINIDEASGQVVDYKFLETDEGKKKYPFVSGNWGPRKGLQDGKNWGLILKQLLGEEVTE